MLVAFVERNGSSEEVAQVASRRGLTTRQLGRLVDEWLVAQDQTARDRVLAQGEWIYHSISPSA